MSSEINLISSVMKFICVLNLPQSFDVSCIRVTLYHIISCEPIILPSTGFVMPRHWSVCRDDMLQKLLTLTLSCHARHVCSGCCFLINQQSVACCREWTGLCDNLFRVLQFRKKTSFPECSLYCNGLTSLLLI